MPDFTKAFSKAYDAIRSVTLPSKTTLALLDDSGDEIDSVTRGWTVEEVFDETTGGRILELRVTDEKVSDYGSVVFFEFSDYRYERQGFPNPPVNNPREWVWRLVPVGRAT